MTRTLLTVALGVLALGVGLWTTVVAGHNHRRAENLARLQRQIEMQRAANVQAEALAAAHVWGQAPSAPAAALPEARP